MMDHGEREKFLKRKRTRLGRHMQLLKVERRLETLEKILSSRDERDNYAAL
jgi:hypothetical protein